MFYLGSVVSISNELVRHVVKNGYRVDRFGNVYNTKGILRSCNKDKHGYNRFTIKYEGKCRSVYVHKVVAYQKFGEEAFKKGQQVRHLNGKQDDCSYENISIGTPSENIYDINVDVRKKKALKAAKSLRKFSDSDIKRIRSLRGQGLTLSKIAEEFDTVKSTIFYIVKKVTYQ